MFKIYRPKPHFVVVSDNHRSLPMGKRIEEEKEEKEEAVAPSLIQYTVIKHKWDSDLVSAFICQIVIHVILPKVCGNLMITFILCCYRVLQKI